MTYRRYVSILHLQWKYTWKAFAGIILLLCAGEGYFFYQRLIHTDYQIEANESINNWDATLNHGLQDLKSFWHKVILRLCF